MKAAIEEEEVFFVTAKPDKITNVPDIAAGVMLDTKRDYGAWPADEGILPERAVRFGKLATAPELTGQGFGEQVTWPLIQDYARAQGFDAIYCEAFPVEKLDAYYRTLGLTAYGEKTYRSEYYEEFITANRYAYDLRSNERT